MTDTAIFMLILVDALGLPSGQVHKAEYNLLIYAKTPREWAEGEVPEATTLFVKGPRLRPEKLELLFEALYGANWRAGNSDGSRYVVLDVLMQMHNPKTEWSTPSFTEAQLKARTPPLEMHFFAVNAAGVFERVSAF